MIDTVVAVAAGTDIGKRITGRENRRGVFQQRGSVALAILPADARRTFMFSAAASCFRFHFAAHHCGKTVAALLAQGFCSIQFFQNRLEGIQSVPAFCSARARVCSADALGWSGIDSGWNWKPQTRIRRCDAPP